MAREYADCRIYQVDGPGPNDNDIYRGPHQSGQGRCRIHGADHGQVGIDEQCAAYEVFLKRRQPGGYDSDWVIMLDDTLPDTCRTQLWNLFEALRPWSRRVQAFSAEGSPA